MKIAVLLSGGVDSSVALRRLLAEGHREVLAFYLKIWLEDDLASLGSCPWEEDLKYARAVCEQASVPLEIVPLQKEYLDRVVSYTLSELRAGRSPSPDIFCNQRIKFGAFFDRIDSSFERVASGHYARLVRKNGDTLLYKGVDPVKDQTYFLSHLSQEQLSRCLFPIGDLEKRQVRQLASEYGLPNEDRPDSQGICFLGKICYDDFVRFHLGEKRGPIIDLDTERELGEHQGYWFHTIGQRKGLGLGQGPWFVVGKDLERNIIYVSHQERLDPHRRDRFIASNPNWIVAPPEKQKLQVKLRHSKQVYDARVALLPDDEVEVQLAENDAGVAPGQFTVFYDGELCLGGAMIS